VVSCLFNLLNQIDMENAQKDLDLFVHFPCQFDLID